MNVNDRALPPSQPLSLCWSLGARCSLKLSYSHGECACAIAATVDFYCAQHKIYSMKSSTLRVLRLSSLLNQPQSTKSWSVVGCTSSSSTSCAKRCGRLSKFSLYCLRKAPSLNYHHAICAKRLTLNKLYNSFQVFEMQPNRIIVVCGGETAKWITMI